MIINIFRGTGILLFILILIMDDFPFYKKMKEPYVQLILAIFTVFLLILDGPLGFIISMILMLIYFEIYKKIDKKNTNINNITVDDKYMLNPLKTNKLYENFSEIEKIKKDVIELDYITEKHLEDAQNNIINSSIYDNELDKENDIYYGAQGLKFGNNDNITGYNSNEYILNWQ